MIPVAENDIMTEDQESERFNSMLSAAQKQVGVPSVQSQIAALLEDDDDDVPSNDTAPGMSETGYSGESYDTGEGGQKPAPSLAQIVPDDDDDFAIADRLRQKISEDAQMAAENTEAKAKKEKKVKEKKPLDKAALAKILTVAAVVVAAALGYCVSLLFFTDAIKTPEQEFSIKAANAVASKLTPGNEMYFYKAYFRKNASYSECMLYGISSDGSSEKTDMYHIVVNDDLPNQINVHYTIDPDSPEFLFLLGSANEDDRTRAERLKRFSDDITEADREIQINSPGWIKIDCTVINKNVILPEVPAAAVTGTDKK